LAQANYYVEEPHLSFEGGLIFGTNISQVDGDTYWGYHKVGLNTGATVYIHFSNKIGVSMDLLYSQKGSRAASASSSANFGTVIDQYHMDLNYVEVPVTFHLRQAVNFLDAKRVIDFEMGASYEYLIKTSEWAVIDQQTIVIDPVLNRFNNDDIEGVVGASIKLYKNLNLNMRYQYSLTMIRPADRVPIGFSYGSGQYNNLFVFRLIYYFGKKEDN